jgi:hypothetical protein
MNCPRCEGLPDRYLNRVLLDYCDEKRRVEYTRQKYEEWWEANKERVLEIWAERDKQLNEEKYEILQRCGTELNKWEKDFCLWWENEIRTNGSEGQ